MSARHPLDMAGRRLGVVTFGCKVNQYESAFMADAASRAGFSLCAPTAAELLIVNTCTVTARSDRQIRQFLRQAAQWETRPELLVTGCYAQRAPLELAGFARVRGVFGNREKGAWPELAALLLAGGDPGIRVADMGGCTGFTPMPVANFYGHTRAFVKIQDGCNHLCSYCIVPAVRGPERSLPGDEVGQQLEVLRHNGFRELVLTGINLSRYGSDLPGETGLINLVRRLGEQSWPGRLRLSSLEPQDLSLGLLQELAKWPQFCPHFHIPLQSGSAAVLKAMHRTYQPRWFEALIRQIQAMFPAAAIGLDVMVGFPTETAADFAQTRDLLQRLPIAYLHVFPYSPRPGTVAAGLRPASTAKEVQVRARELRSLGMEKKKQFYQRFLGVRVEVLVEGEVAGRPGWLTGLTANYLRVHLPGPGELAKQIIPVRLREVEGQVLIGIPVS